MILGSKNVRIKGPTEGKRRLTVDRFSISDEEWMQTEFNSQRGKIKASSLRYIPKNKA